MTSDKDELNRRRKMREAARKKQALARKRLMFQLVLAGVILVLVGLLIWWVSSSGKSGPRAAEDTPPVTQAALPPVTQPPAPPKEGKTVIHIAAAGDLNITDKTVAAGKTADGYDYTDVFMDVAPVLSNADLAILNLEGNLCGEPYGGERASAPQAMMDAIAAAGVDMIQMANSYSIQNGVQGLGETLNNIRLAGMEPLGAYASNSEAKAAKGYTICNVQGLKIALVAFTKGMNNLGLPDGSEKCVNLLYKDYATTYQDVNTSGITRVLQDVAEEKPDFTIALVHWGSEFNEEISSSQKEIRNLMLSHGVNAIIGTHPHLVQTVSHKTADGTLVAYSLGDFFGDAEMPGSNYSIIIDLEITRDNVTGTTRLTGWSYTPICILRPEESGRSRMQVVRIDSAMAGYKQNYIDKIPEKLYESMEYDRQRITERIRDEVE